MGQIHRFGGARRAALLCALAATLTALALPDVAGAATSVFNKTAPSETAIACAPQADGVRFCSGTEATFDDLHTPLDVAVTLPPTPSSGGDGPYPLVILGHGWGGGKQTDPGSQEAKWIDSPDQWAKRGYVVLNNTDRGFAGSCGSAAARLTGGAACAQGWIKLMQAGFEVRDAQYLAGLLVDDGLVDAHRIGATGESYGGGESLMLATLKDRIFDPNGHFAPWVSPVYHTPMSIAGAAPTIPWSDLISSLMPNGHGLDFTITGPVDNFSDAAGNPLIGVEKQSFVTGLYALGQSTGYYAPPNVDAGADLTSWYGVINAGEPYEQPNTQVQPIIDSFKAVRGPY
jgi:hypothetical protein